MPNYRTAMGRVVDMDALAAKNEHVRAVGNMNVNSRGDTIDAMGRVTRSATDKANQLYSNTVKNASAQPRQKTPPPPAPKIDVSELTEAEKELEESFEDDLEIEQIKAQETKGKQ